MADSRIFQSHWLSRESVEQSSKQAHASERLSLASNSKNAAKGKNADVCSENSLNFDLLDAGALSLSLFPVLSLLDEWLI